MKREFYSDTISTFLSKSESAILGELTAANRFTLESTQSDAWIEQIRIMKAALAPYQSHGKIYFEYSIPRLGRRIDVLALIEHVIFVIEFKVGEKTFEAHAVDQVVDYALDLKHFHQSSHHVAIAPILLATHAGAVSATIDFTPQDDRLLVPIKATPSTLVELIRQVLALAEGPAIDSNAWEQGRYCPTPTIIEAATALYSGHSVADISRSDAGAVNLTATSESVSQIIKSAKADSKKVICFVTGVPGAGKTLVGLNIATTHSDSENDLYSVFLSGNAPLVAILREALTRDKVRQEKERGQRLKKGEALRSVKKFIQNVHHFRDDCLNDGDPPIEHVVLFDEAQRTWNHAQTEKFMRQKKSVPNFSQSEPEFLISCLNRHSDWAVIVCLVGGGQEINTGEAGIGEWIESLVKSFPQWHIHISSRLTDSEFGAGEALGRIRERANVVLDDGLHLKVSMRSFRAENVSFLVKKVLDREAEEATESLREIGDRFPIALTRDLQRAKCWLKDRARGTERYGVVVSSQAQRLKPYAIDVKSPMDPIHWFLNGKEDVRSSYYLEDVATEFHVQGLELDWACVAWDADFRYSQAGWEHWSFVGDRWNRIRKLERQMYLKNAYRVLLTRARQGMVIVVPEGDAEDPTRDPSYYDATYEYLKDIGFEIL